jgi:hypothetical protein
MRFFRSPSRFFECLLAVVAFFGIPAPAHAVPQLFTFAGPITFSRDCLYHASGLIFCEDDVQTGTITYTVLVDLGRLGERVVHDASDGTTITTFPATFFADFRTEPEFNIGGDPERNVTTEEHIGAGITLHDLDKVTNTLDTFVLELSSLHDIVGLPGATFTVGSHFQGHQFEFSHSLGERTRETDSTLTLTEIHGVPEPSARLLVSVSLVALVGWMGAGRLRSSASLSPARLAPGSPRPPGSAWVARGAAICRPESSSVTFVFLILPVVPPAMPLTPAEGRGGRVQPRPPPTSASGRG